MTEVPYLHIKVTWVCLGSSGQPLLVHLHWQKVTHICTPTHTHTHKLVEMDRKLPTHTHTHTSVYSLDTCGCQGDRRQTSLNQHHIVNKLAGGECMVFVCRF